MSTVKFECPACGQNMECERARSGDVIHCPGCGAQIRVPFHHAAEMDGTLSRAQLIAPAAPAPIAPAPTGPTSHDPSPAITHHELASTVVECPACHAELKVMVTAGSESLSSTATQKAERAERESTATSQGAAEPEHPDFAHMSLEEREKQIARAREAHPIQVNSNPKPRLEYVLAGKAPPPRSNPDEPGQ